MPKVSIIIPTYNRKRFVQEAIASALAQDYPNLEVVVSDNGSKDGTGEEIAKLLGDPRIKYFRNEANIGMYPNMRLALYERASGDWALLLDDDDYLIDCTYVSKAMSLVKRHENIVMVHANCRLLNEQTNGRNDDDKCLPEVVDGTWMFLNYIYAVKGKTNFAKSTVLFNRSLACNAGFLDDTIMSSDRQCFLKMCMLGDVGFINTLAAVYRIHTTNTTYDSDYESFVENLRAVTGPFEFAALTKRIDGVVLERWKRRMIRDSFECALVQNISSGKLFKEDSWKLLKLMMTDYPYALMAILALVTPRNLYYMSAKCARRLLG